MALNQVSLAVQLLRLAIIFAPNAGGVVLSLLIDVIAGGPNGKLRAEREHFFEGHSIEKVRDHLQKRLQADNFQLIKTGDLYHMQAARIKRRPKESVMTEFPYEGMKLLVEIYFQPHPKGTAGRLSVQCQDFILRDTGEGEYLQAMLDFLSLKPAVRSIAPALNAKCYMAMLNALAGALLPLIYVVDWPGTVMLDLFFGIAIALFANFSIAFWGIVQVLAGGRKYRGIAFALAAILISMGTISISIFIQFFNH